MRSDVIFNKNSLVGFKGDVLCQRMSDKIDFNMFVNSLAVTFI